MEMDASVERHTSPMRRGIRNRACSLDGTDTEAASTNTSETAALHGVVAMETSQGTRATDTPMVALWDAPLELSGGDIIDVPLVPTDLDPGVCTTCACGACGSNVVPVVAGSGWDESSRLTPRAGEHAEKETSVEFKSMQPGILYRCTRHATSA